MLLQLHANRSRAVGHHPHEEGHTNRDVAEEAVLLRLRQWVFPCLTSIDAYCPVRENVFFASQTYVVDSMLLLTCRSCARYSSSIHTQDVRVLSPCVCCSSPGVAGISSRRVWRCRVPHSLANISRGNTLLCELDGFAIWFPCVVHHHTANFRTRLTAAALPHHGQRDTLAHS